MKNKIDLKIILLLTSNSHISLSRIAEKLGISKGTVRNRINALTKRVIVGYTAKIRFQQLGMTEVLIGFDIMPEHYLDVIKHLKNIGFVYGVYRTTGDHSAIARVIIKSEDVERELSTLKKIKGVKHIYPSFVQDIVK